MKSILQSCILLFFPAATLMAQPNCSANPTGLVPINDLGTGISPVTGLMGGLYPGGSNFLPPAHKSAGLQMASEIRCLDANGNPDAANGRIVWLSIGMSNCTQETQQFIRQANAFSGKNPKLTLVDGAQGGQTAQVISAPWHSNYNNFWNTVGNRMAAAGVTAQQVQVIWLKEANQVGNTAVKPYYDSLVVQFKRIANELKTRFPNVKLCYMASRISARYATTNLNPEPHSYWTGWAVKKVIEDQINGDPQLSFSGPDARSPWLSWGIYLWSDGSTPQVSNPDIFFSCPTDFQNDGTHPSTAGAQKVGGLLLKFFSSDSTASSWFTGTGCSTTVQTQESSDGLLSIHPNPASDHLSIRFNGNFAAPNSIYIIDLFGKEVLKQNIPGGTESTVLDISILPEGLYVLRHHANGLILKVSK